MSETTKRLRGRPAGTGIDDRLWLDRIAHMISTAPQIAPTTAIRSLGIDNPSTIRRLREKLKDWPAASSAA